MDFNKIYSRLILNEEGQGLAEYALILVFVAIAVIVSLGSFGNAVVGWFNDFVAEANKSD